MNVPVILDSGKVTREWMAALFVRVVAFCILAGGFSRLEAEETASGLSVHFRSGDQSMDVRAMPNVWLYVPAGESPTPFLPVGFFDAEWRGFLSVDVRGFYSFRAELNGEMELLINDQVALEASAEGEMTDGGRLLRLNQGPNEFRLRYSAPPEGDAFLRLFRAGREGPFSPIPSAAFTRSLEDSDREPVGDMRQLHHGRELLIQHRCLQCHQGPSREVGIPDLFMDAPSFEGIGSRLHGDWMAEWILDPSAHRASARMPKMLHGSNAAMEAEAIAAYLSTLKEEVLETPVQQEPEEEWVAAGRRLFNRFHCTACHNDPDGEVADSGKISLSGVGLKFTLGALEAYLLKPDAHYAWSRMPDFQLNAAEARDLASFLNEGKMLAPLNGDRIDQAVIETGRRLVQTTGCLNCHNLDLENHFSAPSLAATSSIGWEDLCREGVVDESPHLPFFAFTSEETDALRAFISSDQLSLVRHVRADFAERHLRDLNCIACHTGRLEEGVPHLDILGGKLKPEWSEKLLAGELEYKPRPWLNAHMPAFREYAADLAQGMAMQHGHPPVTPAELPVESSMVEIGQRLISSQGGFNCIACHAVGDQQATTVFEVQGNDFATTGERLLRSFHHEWVLDPRSIDPTSKMPAFFFGGNSPFFDLLEGDAMQQIEAMWQYFRRLDEEKSD